MKKMILITQFLRGALFRMSLDFSGGAILIRSTEKESFSSFKSTEAGVDVST